MTRAPAIPLVLALVASACASPAAAEEIRSGAPRAAADPAAAQRAGAALDAFAADLYRVLATDDDNLVLSPYSVAIALAMTRAGAAGETRAQMDRVLHASLVADLDAAFNALDQALAKRPGKFKVNDQELELELATADRLWGQRGFTFEQPFLDRLATSYGAGMRIVDYEKATEDARREINGWVAERTRDRIKDLIPQGVLDQMTRLVLTNAIYLKAAWSQRFGDASPGPFRRADGQTVQAQVMRLSAQLPYASAAGYQAVRLPYAGGLSMLVIVPDAGTLGAFERSLDGAAIGRIAGGLTGVQVNLGMPKFEFRKKAALKGALSALGMPIAFTDAADLSGISRQARLTIADVIHEGFISVDEQGTEAAAATAVVVGITSAPSRVVDLEIDRPFLFLIRDDETGATLFMGRVMDPTK